MPVVFWFSKLQPNVKAEDYERWVREVDYHYAKQIPSIISYRVHHINGSCLGDETLSYDYLEVAEVTDIADYRRDIAEHPAAQKIVAEIGNYVESTGNAWGTQIDDST